MDRFAKLFSEIITSSIWSEDDKTRIVWITMLALKDLDGYVPAAMPGLAAIARVSVEECENAVKKLESPDKYSRTPDNEGRRIKKTEGGWIVLNHELWMQRGMSEYQKEQNRERAKRFREKHNKVTPRNAGVTQGNAGVTVNSTDADADADADIDTRGIGGEPPPPVGILEFCLKIKNCHPDFKNLNQMALENVFKGIPVNDAQSAVNDFCRDYAGANKTPDLPVKKLAGYLRKAYDAAQPLKPRSNIT